MKKWLIIILGLLLISVPVQASKADLDIFPPKASACRLGTAQYEVSIENLGPVEDTFEVTANSGCKCTTIRPGEVTLEKGEEKKVYLWYNPDTSMEPGNYEFTVKATSQTTGETYTKNANVEVLGCHDLDLNIKDGVKSTCRNGSAKFEVYVKNSGREKEKVKMKSDYSGTFSNKEFSLEPGENKKVFYTAESGPVGSKDINIKAESLSSYASSSKLVTLNTEKCYDSEISVTPKKKEVCSGLEGEWEVTVKNKGTKKDSFTLHSNRGQFVKNNLEIEPGEYKTTTFFFNPPKVRNYTLSLRAESHVRSSKEIKVIGKDCKSVSVITTPTVREACEDEDVTYKAKIENTGKVEDSYSIVSNLGVLTQNRVVLEPGKSKTIGLDVKPSVLEIGRQKVKVRVRSQTSDAEDYSEVEINVLNCYDLNISMETSGIVCDGINATLYTIKLENIGKRPNEYNINVKGPEWLSNKPNKVEVNPGEVKRSYIYAAAPYNVSGAFDITLAVEDSSGTVKREKSFEIKVGKIPGEDELPDEIPDEITGKELLNKAFDRIKGFLENYKIPVELFFSAIAGIILVVAILAFEIRRS